MISFAIPVRTSSLTNLRTHWAQKAKVAREHRDTTRLVWRQKRICDVPLPAVVTLTRIAPRALDDDNLRPALKHVRDQIAEQMGLDDRDARVEWRYGQGRGRSGVYAVEVTIERREEADVREMERLLAKGVVGAFGLDGLGFVADVMMPKGKR